MDSSIYCCPSASQVQKVKIELGLGGHTLALSEKKSTSEEYHSNEGEIPVDSELDSLGFPPGFDPEPRQKPVPVPELRESTMQKCSRYATCLGAHSDKMQLLI